MKREKKNVPFELVRKSRSFRWKLTVAVFFITAFSILLTIAIYYIILTLLGTAHVIIGLTVNPIFAAFILLCACGIIFTIMFAWLSRFYLRPLNRLTEATKEVRKGNYKVTIPEHAKPPTSEMEELTHNFNEMTRELDGIELFRNDFINNFSHEFKTPIVSIRGFAKELQYSDLTGDQRQEYARIIEEESDRLARLASSVLELSKLEHQQIVTDRTAFYLDEQIRQCILMLEPEWSKKDLEILPDLTELKFVSNEEMLSAVWRNLLSNAIKFTPHGGEIKVEMHTEPGFVTVSVKDTGIGMSGETIDHIFEKFFQGDTSHSRKGYGIGLAIVGRVVKLCNGTISVESEPGKGTCFNVRLPMELL